MTEGGLTRYFKSIAHIPTYLIGDRIFGHWNGMPFIGSVGHERVRNGQAECTVHLDLPIKYEEIIYNVIVVKIEDIKLLKVL
jgi:hypothetical protein